MYAHPATRWPQFITLLGGIIARFCFFMPWEGIGPIIGQSGFELKRERAFRFYYKV